MLPLVMGIVNRTPDSFFEASRSNPETVEIDTALRMLADGADILDIGGESSRPGSEYVSARQEIQRIVPFIRSLREHSSVALSVDTRKAEVAAAAAEAGADIVNDISALRDDPEIAAVAKHYDMPLVLMHMAGTPATMQNNPSYSDVVAEVERFLLDAADRAVAAGIPAEKIILDPGIGFGKRYQDNLDLVRAIPRLRAHGFPVLLGISRKTVLGQIAGSTDNPVPVDDRLAVSVVAQVIAAQFGADILRVHDVAATRQGLAAAKAFGCLPAQQAFDIKKVVK